MSNSSVNWKEESMKSGIDLKNDVLKDLSREQGINEAERGDDRTIAERQDLIATGVF
jgi:hypothetical protein